jgi:hypothetical protein
MVAESGGAKKGGAILRAALGAARASSETEGVTLHGL